MTSNALKCWLLLLSFHLFFGTLAPKLASAQQRYEAYRREVKELYQQGGQLFSQKAYKRALVKLKAAYSLLKEMESEAQTPKQKKSVKENRIRFLYFLGQTYEADGNLSEAVVYYIRCIREAPKSKAAQVTTRSLRRLMPRIQVTLSIETTPSSSRIRLFDPLGEEITNQSPATFRLLPGSIRFTIEQEGYLPQSHEMTLKLKEDKNLRFVLQPKKRIAAITSKPPSPQPPSAGILPILGWASTGLGIAGVLVGGILLVVVDRRVSSIEEKLGKAEFDSVQIHRETANAQAMEIGAFSSLGLGAILLGLGVTALVLSSQKSAKAKEASKSAKAKETSKIAGFVKEANTSKRGYPQRLQPQDGDYPQTKPSRRLVGVQTVHSSP
jgi:hypothetical protein